MVILKPNEGFNFTWGMAQELLNQLGYVQVTGFMLDAYAELGLSRNEFLCIIHLARFHYNSPQGIARPSATNVAKKMGYGHPNSVRQLVKNLEGKKMLLVVRRSGKCSIYDASPFAKAAFEIWQKQNPNIPMLGSNGNTLIPQCETPSHPNVTEENEEAKEVVKEKNISPIGDKIHAPDLPIEEPKKSTGYKPGPGKVISCVDPDTDEEVGEPNWRFPQTQIQHQAFNITGRKRFHSKAEYNKMRKIEYKLENGELPHEFWEAQKGCARAFCWKFPILLKSTLNPDRFREWQASEAEYKKRKHTNER